MTEGSADATVPVIIGYERGSVPHEALEQCGFTCEKDLRNLAVMRGTLPPTAFEAAREVDGVRSVEHDRVVSTNFDFGI